MGRRESVQAATAAAVASALPSAAVRSADGKPLKPDLVLAGLLAGNKRFVDGKLEHPGRGPKDFQALAEEQNPHTIILGCADSRVPPEVIFDQGVGDLFVVRGAGNMVGSGPILKGSIEFAVAELGVRLVLVLGHTKCGACKAAIKHIEDKDMLPGSIEGLVDYIRPSVRMVAGKPGDMLTNVIKENVLAGVKKLQTQEPILAKLAKDGELKIVGGFYDLATGKVEIYT